jgi:hypothetical protein
MTKKRNKDNYNAYMRGYRSKNTERSRELVENSRVKATYGITLAEKKEIWESQGECCAACRARDNGGRRWTIDHDHDTGEIRGLLCKNCNTALGMVGDSPYRLTALLGYLGRTTRQPLEVE